MSKAARNLRRFYEPSGLPKFKPMADGLYPRFPMTPEQIDTLKKSAAARDAKGRPKFLMGIPVVYSEDR